MIWTLKISYPVKKPIKQILWTYVLWVNAKIRVLNPSVMDIIFTSQHSIIQPVNTPYFLPPSLFMFIIIIIFWFSETRSRSFRSPGWPWRREDPPASASWSGLYTANVTLWGWGGSGSSEIPGIDTAQQISYANNAPPPPFLLVVFMKFWEIICGPEVPN